jgi:bidirectional [NiFe] hydrogenase diaphorase subunit
MIPALNHAHQIGEPNRNSPRIKRLATFLRGLGHKPDALIQALHVAQGMYGYLPLDIIRFIASELKVPPSRAYGVVTFYHFFSLRPKGEHNCLVCTGTACYVKGAQGLIDRIEADFDVHAGGTTADNTLGLQTARCIGACGLAPAVTFDEEILGKVKADDVTRILRDKLAKAAS